MTIQEINELWFNNPKYYNSDTIRNLTIDNHSVDIALIFSGRNRGKSFDISARALLDAWTSKGDIQFGYCRRLEKEMANYKVEQYFEDKNEFIRDISDNKADCIICYNGVLYFGKTRTEKGKTIRERLFAIGNTFALSVSRQYKSLQYPKITRLIFEEVFTDEGYLSDEPRKLLNLISTIQRGRNNFICYMISNTVSRINPYTDAFCLNLLKMQSGTLDKYKLLKGTYDDNGNEEFYFIAVEYLKDADNEKQSTSKKAKQSSILTNKWDEARIYPCVCQSHIDKYDSIYKCIFQNGAFAFIGHIKQVPINYQEYINALIDNEETPKLSDDTMNVLFITRKTTPYKYDIRLYTSEPIVYPLATRGIIAICELDKEIMRLVEIGHTFYANNLIANEFTQCYKQLKLTRGI